ncbi:hypothetical protein CERZMDRAFT_90564 [Cercospora zeae-maydis SCOH1-5]|uniref:Uncharacterized protein n=1 Tax=Cercospora zeae-maydis SCOH1-5 TaxID=717836 RepID=A0A6A6FI50_9PEZI|nr:hypothetical protein CERZMDRAFT_90564 [Cercospora zeae-maydis SCOH1-5]
MTVCHCEETTTAFLPAETTTAFLPVETTRTAADRPRLPGSVTTVCRVVETAIEGGHARHCLREEKTCRETIYLGESLQETTETTEMPVTTEMTEILDPTSLPVGRRCHAIEIAAQCH